VDALIARTPEQFREQGIDARVRHEVMEIDPASRRVRVQDIDGGRVWWEPYDHLLIATGAIPVRPDVPGADAEGIYGVSTLQSGIVVRRVVDEQKPRRAVIVGGGYIGLEMAEVLRHRGLAVSLVELEPQVMGPADPEMAAPLHEHLTLQGVDLNLGASVTAIGDRDGRPEALLSSGRAIPCDLVILAVGVRPEVKLAVEAGLTIGQRKGIVVDDHMRTSDPDIYAVGDAVEVQDFVGGFAAVIPLAGPANRQGRIAAINALGGEAAYHKTQGTAICKVFDLAIGMTGMSEKALKRTGRSYEKVYIHPASHAGYYPGAMQMSLKLLFDPANGKILGAQCVGADGVDKRIDVLAVAVRAGLTVYDLEELELSYAPPFGSAKDAVNYAGFVAANLLRKEASICHAADAANPGPKQMLLDVRTLPEVQKGTIPGAKHIPLDELRTRLGELPKDKEILAFCEVGLRGYLACRILTQDGFACRNLSGGYKTYCHTVGRASGAAAAKREVKQDSAESGLEPPPAGGSPSQIVKEIDARGLQCPGPIMQLKQAMDRIQPGQAVRISVSDPAFASDLDGWCHTTGNRLRDKQLNKGMLVAVVEKSEPVGATPCGCPSQALGQALEVGQARGPAPAANAHKTLVVFSDSFDKAMASFIIANGAAAMGSEVTMFFTFWGLNLLRQNRAVPVQKTFIERMFGWMMPRGAEKAVLSKMNMAGMGTAMIKGIMRKKNVLSLPELIEAAKRAGVRLVACSMTMDLMGIKREELIDGVEEGGVAMYLDRAGSANVNLFIG